MTREEAIENLKGCVCGYEVDKDGKPNGNVTADLTQETIDMAIKALEAPPNDNWEGYSKRLWKSAYERGKADAEQRWIPVSERLPEQPYGCLVTIEDEEPMTGQWFENILPYFVGWDGERWNDADGEQCPFEVIAWMPLPNVYRNGE